MKITKNFIIPEFVPKEIYEMFGDRSVMFINRRIPPLVQYLRDRYNKPIKINDWYWGGEFNWSGYRTPDCPVGAKLSRHKLGVCADIKVSGMEAPEVQLDIVNNFEEHYKPLGLTTIEADTPTWTHISNEWTMDPRLVIIPKF